MEEIKINNLVKLYTLMLLFERPQHGYHIIKNTGQKLGKNVSPGEIYPFLGLLEKRGLIVSQRVKERDKKTYSLTPKGKGFVRGLLERFGDMIHVAVERSLKKCHHCGCEVYKGSFLRRGKTYCCRACALSY